jgi:hypothetical protein
MRKAKSTTEPLRVVIAFDGDAWFVRRLAIIEHDLTRNFKVYHCDKHLGGPYVSVTDAASAVEALYRTPDDKEAKPMAKTTTKLPQTEAEWKKVDHYFARGLMAYGRGLTAKDAIAQARKFMGTGRQYTRYRKAAAFDVWRVPAGDEFEIDGMGTVTWSKGVERMQKSTELESTDHA